MTQLAPAFDTANPQDATPSIEVVEEQTQEVTSEPESEEVVEETTEEEVVTEEDKTKPEFKRIVKRGPPPSWERYNEVYGQMKRLDRLAMQLLDERKTKPAEETKAEPEVDWDSLTPKQFAAEMLKAQDRNMQRLMSQTLVPIQKQEEVRAAANSITITAKKYPDYFDHRDAMIEIAEKHPSLDAEEVYLLATGKKGPATDAILTRAKDKVQQKKNALTTRRSSLNPTTTKAQGFKNIREGALAAAKSMGYDIE